jgi:hypothetical protein
LPDIAFVLQSAVSVRQGKAASHPTFSIPEQGVGLIVMTWKRGVHALTWPLALFVTDGSSLPGRSGSSQACTRRNTVWFFVAGQ